MKLKTSLQLSAIFPIAFATFVILILRWRFGPLSDSAALDASFACILGLLGVTMAAIIISYSRDVLRKLNILNKWIDAVVAGNLDHNVGIENADDEVGKLSRALSRMLRDLKQAYSELYEEASMHEQQSAEHKKLAEASQAGTKQLATALEHLKKSQKEMARRERLHVLDQIIRGITHDLNETLMPILGTSELLLSYPETLKNEAVALDHLRTIRDAVQEARKTTKNLAAFSHGEPRPSDAVPLDVNRVVEQAIDMTRPRWREEAQANGISIRLGTDLQQVPRVGGDQSELRDALASLILNAAESVDEEGFITITTRATMSTVTIEISDTGRGMPDEVKKHCLEPFYSTKDSDGTGMGLTVVNGAVRRHRGTLKIESKEGEGTRVIVELPVWSGKDGRSEGLELDLGPMRGKRILVVDDALWSREIVAKTLSSEGHTVETAGNGQEGLDKIDAGRFDVAIIDRAMTGMGGDELAATIKRLSPGMPVIMLTGFADTMKEEGDVPEHVDVLLPKPATVHDLQRALVQAMKASQSVD